MVDGNGRDVLCEKNKSRNVLFQNKMASHHKMEFLVIIEALEYIYGTCSTSGEGGGGVKSDCFDEITRKTKT